MILTDGPTLRIVVPDGAAPSPAARAIGTLEEAERHDILEALEQTRGRISGDQGAARILGVKPTTLEYRMKKLGIERKAARFDRPPDSRPLRPSATCERRKTAIAPNIRGISVRK